MKKYYKDRKKEYNVKAYKYKKI